jgi:hypothetical protein
MNGSEQCTNGHNEIRKAKKCSRAKAATFARPRMYALAYRGMVKFRPVSLRKFYANEKPFTFKITKKGERAMFALQGESDIPF